MPNCPKQRRASRLLPHETTTCTSPVRMHLSSRGLGRGKPEKGCGVRWRYWAEEVVLPWPSSATFLLLLLLLLLLAATGKCPSPIPLYLKGT